MLFYALAIYKWLNGMFMYQMEPHFFNTRFDGTTWLLMQTGIHTWLLDNKTGWLLFDLAFYSIPLLWYSVWKKNEKTATWAALAWLVVNYIYIQCYTLFPTVSIEASIAWLLMPILFATSKTESFYYVMHGLRYFFLFFFASAAVWKIRQGGVFNADQMSGILLYQHKEFLVSAPHSLYTRFIYWLVKHTTISYLLYLAGFLLELSFIIGFLTRRYDRWLIAGFIAFLIMDLFLMRIPYFETLPLMLPLYFSKYVLEEETIPAKKIA